MPPLTKSQLLFSATTTHTTVTDRNRVFFKIPNLQTKIAYSDRLLMILEAKISQLIVSAKLN